MSKAPKPPKKAEIAPVPAAAVKKRVAVVKREGDGKFAKHEPTDHIRAIVAMGMAMGMTHEQIARRAKISIPTLVAYYQDELQTGADEINMSIAANIASIAKDRNHPKCLTAAIWWTKTRMGWVAAREEPEDADDDVEPVVFTVHIGDKSANG